MRITPFVRPWSTMTINESCPFNGGKLVIRLTDSCLKGRAKDVEMEASERQVGWWLTLFCWHIAQAKIKALMYDERGSATRNPIPVRLWF